MKWCAWMVLPHLPPQCRCGDLLLSYRRVEMMGAGTACSEHILSWNGNPGWTCTTSLLGQSQALCD